MIVVDIEQYSPEWWAARLGIPTASMFGRLVTSTGKMSASFKEEIFRMAAEIILGIPEHTQPNEWMVRGSELEPQAREAYEFISGFSVSQPGLVYRDDSLAVSCSPDGFIGKDGGLEIKCPSPSVHLAYLHEGVLPTKYKPQVFGSLWVCDEVKWWDFMSYHPGIQPFIIRVDRTTDGYQEYANALDKYIPIVTENIKEIVGMAKETGTK